MKKPVHFQMLFNSVDVRSDEWSIIIKGKASTPKLDRYRSIITTDAIRNWMWNYVKNPVVLLWHNPDKPIWTTIEHSVDNTWLNVTVKLVRNTDNVFENIRDWITKWFSIWFIPLNRVYETKDWRPLQSLTSDELDELNYDDIIRKITEIDMVELSVVNTPANADALFTMARAVKLFFETQEKRAFWLMWMATRSSDNTDENQDETAKQADTEENKDEDETTDDNEETDDKEDVKTDENWEDDDEDEDKEPEKSIGKQKLTDDDFKAVEDDEDEDDDDNEEWDDDTDDEDSDEDDEWDEEQEDEAEQKTDDQENSDNTQGNEVENAGETPADADKATDWSPKWEPEQRSFVSITEFMSLRNVLNALVDTVSEMWDEMQTLRTDNVELRTQNADLINKLSNMPANKWFRTIWGLEKKKTQWTTIITTLKQAKREAWAWSDEDDDE